MTVVKNYLFNLLLTLANLLFPILSFPYVSRVLGPAGIGKVQFAFSFGQYFSLFAGLGIPIYGIKEIAKYQNDHAGRSKTFSELIVIYFITSIILTTVYLAVVLMVPYFKPDREIFLLAGILVLMSFCFIEWLYSGIEEFRSIALRSVSFKIANLILLYTLVRSQADYHLYLGLLIFSFVGNNVFSLFLLKGRVSLTLTGLELKKHLTPLFYILATTLAASIYSELDTVLLGFLSDNTTVGLYTAAVKFSKISIPFVTSMGIILLPKVGKDFANLNLNAVQETLNKTFTFLVFFSIPLVFGMIMLAPELIGLFSGKAFLTAANTMRVMALLPLIIGFAHMLLYMIMVPSGLNRPMFICSLGGVIASIVLNFILIPRFRSLGCAIANISAEVVVTCLYIYMINKRYKFVYKWELFWQALLSGTTFIPLIYSIKFLDMPSWVTILASIFICVSGYVLIQLYLFKNVFVYEMFGFIKAKLKTT